MHPNTATKMNYPKPFSACLLVLAPWLAQAAILEGPITNLANGHHYYLLTASTWTAAETEARTLGGHLVTIDDSAEDSWLISTFIPPTQLGRELWTGLTDRDAEGSYVWADGSRSTYSGWCPGEPNNCCGGEHFIQIYSCGGGYAWNDTFDDPVPHGGAPVHGVVEVDPNPRVVIEVASVAVRWRSMTNQAYQVQYRSSLTTNAWADWGAPIPGTGSNMVVFDSVLDEPRRFYRVWVLP